MATSYTNPGGSGNRTPNIVIPTFTGTPAITFNTTGIAFVDGATTTNAFFFNTGSNYIIEFSFTSKKIIDEAKWYQSNTASHGTWKWQGSNDRTTWTDVGSSFTLGGATTQTITALAGNITGYVFYRLVQVSGTASSSPWIYEIEFKIDDAGGPSYTHALGSGNRTATITTAINGFTWGAGDASKLINGSFTNEAWWNSGAVAGNWISFDLGAPYVMQQARFYMGGSSGTDEGSWKFQGSTNNSTWVDLSGTILFATTGGTVSPSIYIGGFETNTTSYRYYRILGVSGNRTGSPYQLEIEFMVGDPPSTDARLSQLPLEVATLSSTPIDLRLSQLPLEVATLVPVVPRVTQDVIEIISYPTPDLRVTQDIVEILSAAGVSLTVSVTQDVIEILSTSGVITPPSTETTQFFIIA